MRPQHCEYRVRIAAVHRKAHFDDGHLAIGALMQEFNVEVSQLAFYSAFRRMVKLELLQLIAHAAGNDVAARIDVDEDPAAVIFKRDRAGNVMKFDRLESLVQVRAANVDGGLLVSFRASLVGGVKTAPGEWSRLSVVVPVCSGLRTRHGRSEPQSQRGNIDKSACYLPDKVRESVRKDSKAPGVASIDGRDRDSGNRARLA